MTGLTISPRQKFLLEIPASTTDGIVRLEAEDEGNEISISSDLFGSKSFQSPSTYADHSTGDVLVGRTSPGDIRHAIYVQFAAESFEGIDPEKILQAELVFTLLDSGPTPAEDEIEVIFAGGGMEEFDVSLTTDSVAFASLVGTSSAYATLESYVSPSIKRMDLGELGVILVQSIIEAEIYPMCMGMRFKNNSLALLWTISRSAGFSLVLTMEIDEDEEDSYIKLEDPFNIQISGNQDNNTHLAFYEWDFTGWPEYFLDKLMLSSQIKLYVQNSSSSPVRNIGMVLLNSDAESSPNDIFNEINNTETYIYTSEVRNTNKHLLLVGGNADDIHNSILNTGKVTIGIKPINLSQNSQMHVGGISMSQGIDTPWSVANGINMPDPPYLVLEMEQDINFSPIHYMKYTTTTSPWLADPLPGNSLGGYVSEHLINPVVLLDESASAQQNFVNIDLVPESTPSSGFALLGSEIIKYNNLNEEEKQLQNITRAIVPPFSYSSNTQPYKEQVHFLKTDAIFESRPNEGLIQYRCVALEMQNSSITFPTVILTQNPNADVKIDIGIEIPKWDSHGGSISEDVIDDNIIRSTSEDVIGFPNGFFDGGHIVLNNFPTVENAIIDRYEYDAGIATFYLQSNLPPDTFFEGAFFSIKPAPSQIIINDTSPPVVNGYFSGFFGEGGPNRVVLSEHLNTMNVGDLFYIWIKRTFTQNKSQKENSGAIITVLSIP